MDKKERNIKKSFNRKEREIPQDEKNYPPKECWQRLRIKKKITTFGDPNNYFEVFAEIFPGFHVSSMRWGE